MKYVLAFWIQEFCDSKVSLSHIKSLLKIVSWIGSLQIAIVNQIWPKGRISKIQETAMYLIFLAVCD